MFDRQVLDQRSVAVASCNAEQVAIAVFAQKAQDLAVIETQCPERFADAGDVARQVIIDYEL